MSNGYTTKYLQTSKHMYIWITNTLLLIPPYKIQTYWHICITINSDISLRVIWWMYIYTCWWYKCWWGCMHVYSIWTHYILRKKRNHRICDDDNNNGTKWVMLCFLLVHAFMPFLCLLSLFWFCPTRERHHHWYENSVYGGGVSSATRRRCVVIKISAAALVYYVK